MATIDDYDGETEDLRLLARLRWRDDWDATSRYEENPLRFPWRCSVTYSNRSIDTLDCGVELPGSWHQQKNGGSRFWTSVSGEIDVR